MLKIFISNLKEYNNGKIIGEWVSLPCEGLEEVLNKISNNGNDELFISDYEDVAYQVVNESGLLDGVPETIKGYFDYEAYGRDIDIEGTFIQVDNNIIELY